MSRSNPDENSGIGDQENRRFVDQSKMKYPGNPREHSPTSPVVAEAVPMPLAARYRISWRIGILILCLDRCRGKAATVPQLHVLTWAMQDPDNYNTLMAYWPGRQYETSLRTWNAELEDTLRIARAAGLVAQSSNGRQALTKFGKQLANRINVADSEIFSREREMLRSLGLISTAGMWRRLDASAPPGRGGM